MKLKISIKNKARFNKMPLSLLKNQDGATAVLVAIVLAMLLGFTALAVDVGYMYSTRNELQNVADAAALAGASKLGQIYLNLPRSVVPTFDVDVTGPLGENYRELINRVVMDTAELNRAADKGSIEIDDDNDIIIGHWDRDVAVTDLDNALSTVNKLMPDAVRVFARLNSDINNPVSTFFAKILSIFGGNADTFNVSVVATAALSGINTVVKGALVAPIGISENHSCEEGLISLSPTTSCAAWHNFFDAINASTVGQKMWDLIAGYEGVGYSVPPSLTEGSKWLEAYYDIKKDPIPEATESSTAGDEFDFQGGGIAALFASGGYYADWERGDGDPPPAPTPEGPVIGNIEKPIPFINLFEFYRFRDKNDPGSIIDGKIDVCGVKMDPDDVWTTTVPVYEDSEPCINANTSIKIVRYAVVHIIQPNPPPDSTVTVCFDCDLNVEAGRSGGLGGNVLGSIPNLVQ